MVLAASRAREVTHEDAPVLFNVVEEMAIAGGLPIPKVYIIEDSAPNAFATGRDPEHASVAVTSGLLKKRSEEHTSELQSRQYLVCRLLLEKKQTQTLRSREYNSS